MRKVAFTQLFTYLKTMKRVILLFLILIQIFIIGIIFNDINRKKVLGTLSVNPIQKDHIISSESETLEYFYEPKPNEVIKPEQKFPGIENVVNNINKDGLNQKENYSIEKPPHTFRIAAIGDSFTYGLEVNTSENYPSQLNALLNQKISCKHIKKFEVINLGVYAYDFQYTIERFKRRGIKYNPDLVIWLLIEDDFIRINELIIPKYRSYLEEAKQDKDYEDKIKRGLSSLIWSKAKNEYRSEVGDDDHILEIQKKNLARLNTIYSGNLLFAVLPLDYKYTQFIEKFAEERKNTFIYNLPQLTQHNDTLLPDFHPNPSGYKLISESLLGYLLDKKIIDCSYK